MDTLTMRVYRASDKQLLGSRSLPGLGAGSHAFDWDGLFGSSRVPDGTILIQLVGSRDGRAYSVPAANLADPTINTAPFGIVVDTAAPSLSKLTTSRGSISPNGDGIKDSTVIAATTAGGSVGWSIHVWDGGHPVRSFQGTGGALSATWDGRTQSGVRLPDGSYPVGLYTRDALGNSRSLVTFIRVDTVRPVGAFTTVVPGLSSLATQGTFYPDGDGLIDTVDLRWTSSQEASGTLAIKAGTVTRRTVVLPMTTSGTFRWDGRDGSGRGVADGLYTLVGTITDRAGNTRVFTGSVRVDRTAGSLKATPTTFSPQTGDAYPPTTSITFGLTGSAYTTLRVLKDGVVVRTAWHDTLRRAGTYGWSWDGRNASGVLLTAGSYSVVLIATAGGVTQVLVRTVILAG
jgi:flagellar hook assembly protein FlgD